MEATKTQKEKCRSRQIRKLHYIRLHYNRRVSPTSNFMIANPPFYSSDHELTEKIKQAEKEMINRS
jgi:tRNA1(Val) A37 N6-methylase TrmN6